MLILTDLKNNSSFTTILSVTILVIFFFLKLIQKKLFKDTTKKINWGNIVYSFATYIFLILSITYISGKKIDFEELTSNIGIFLKEKTSLLVGTILVIILSSLFYNIISFFIIKTFVRSSNNVKRKATIVKILKSFLRYGIYIVDAIIILGIWGINLGPILAGLGVAGLVIGLGAQKLITDFISGVFIVFEHQFDIGDIVEVGGFKGEIIDIGLKTTRIRNWKGEVKIVSNGNISELINYSEDFSTAIVDFEVSYKENIEDVCKAINCELEKSLNNEKNILEIPIVQGIMNFVDSDVQLRVIAKVKSEQQYEIERKIRFIIKTTLDKYGIEMPFPQMVIHNGGQNGN